MLYLLGVCGQKAAGPKKRTCEFIKNPDYNREETVPTNSGADKILEFWQKSAAFWYISTRT